MDRSGPSPGAASDTIPEVVVRVPTVGEAFGWLMVSVHVLRRFGDIGYKFNIPEHPKFQAAVQRGEPLTDEEQAELRRIFEEQFYDPELFEPAVQHVEAVRGSIEQAVVRLQTLHRNWGFKVFPKVEVTFNLYPSLGGWNPLDGKVTMCTWEDGSTRCAFGNVGAMEVVVIHEIVHTGIEIPLVERFQLSHTERERLVDLICRGYLGGLMSVPYPMQERGDRRLDAFVERDAIENDLPGAIARFVEAHPRTEKDFNILWWKEWLW